MCSKIRQNRVQMRAPPPLNVAVPLWRACLQRRRWTHKGERKVLLPRDSAWRLGRRWGLRLPEGRKWQCLVIGEPGDGLDSMGRDCSCFFLLSVSSNSPWTDQKVDAANAVSCLRKNFTGQPCLFIEVWTRKITRLRKIKEIFGGFLLHIFMSLSWLPSLLQLSIDDHYLFGKRIYENNEELVWFQRKRRISWSYFAQRKRSFSLSVLT